MKGGTYTKTLAKIQVRGIFRKRDMRRNILPKLIEICMETPCWTMLVLTWMSSNMADGNQQKHLISKLENTIGLPLWITNVNFLTFNKFKRTL